MYSPRFFVSDAQYRHGCENDYTEPANFKSQWCERDVSWSRHMAVQADCKMYWQRANDYARVDGFEKNVSHNIRRPSPQLVNSCLGLSYTIYFSWFSKNSGDNDRENSLRVGIVGNLTLVCKGKTKEKTKQFRTWQSPNGKFVVIWMTNTLHKLFWCDHKSDFEMYFISQ